MSDQEGAEGGKNDASGPVMDALPAYPYAPPREVDPE
jgi:hypothetical protein